MINRGVTGKRERRLIFLCQFTRVHFNERVYGNFDPYRYTELDRLLSLHLKHLTPKSLRTSPVSNGP